MDFKALLKKNSIKSTKPRLEIIEVLESSETPLTLNQINDALTIDIDLSTLYRNLDVFESKGLITKTTHIEPGQNVYDFKRHKHKHHLICTQCGLIQIVAGCPLGNYEHQISEETGFIIDRHQLELYGICPKCQELMR